MTALFWILALASVGMNGFGIWFCYHLLKDRTRIIQYFTNFVPLMKDYEDHLAALSKMDLYYGDPTMSSLLKHTTQTRELLDDLLLEMEVEEKDEDAE